MISQHPTYHQDQQDTNKISTRYQQDIKRISTRYQQDINKIPTRYQQDINKIYQAITVQELAEQRRVLCATVMLDRGVDGLQQRVSNQLYEGCRHGKLEVAGFPDYKPLLSALQQEVPEDNSNSYQVCVKRMDKLLVLSSLADKFLQSEEFTAEATDLVTKHNDAFNPDGDFLAEVEASRTQF